MHSPPCRLLFQLPCNSRRGGALCSCQKLFQSLQYCVDTMLCLAVMLPKGEVWLYSSRFLTAVSVLEEMPLQLLVVVSYLPGLSHGARIKKIRLKLITLLALKCTRISEPLTKKWEKMVKKKKMYIREKETNERKKR